MFNLTINGRAMTLDLQPDTPLLWAIRDGAGLTGTKYGCGAGLCGACSVHLNGALARACQVTVAEAAGGSVTTIEGLSGDGTLGRLQQAWIDERVPQCGYCQSGQLMAAAALIAQTPKPGDAEIEGIMSNICRCGTYDRIKKAIRRATA